MLKLYCRPLPLLTLAPAFLLLSGCLTGNDTEPETQAIQVDTVLDGLENPWGMAFLPSNQGNRALLTERSGQLSIVDLDTGEQSVLDGMPSVAATGQGGLLDVELHPDYGPEQPWVYLTYSAADENDPNAYATHIGRGQLNESALALEEFEVLHVATPFDSSNAHFGSRLTFHDGYLFVTSGDRQVSDSAQDLESHWGATLRLEYDGSIPANNPFVNDPDAQDAIYTYGHRNSQGMAVQPSTGLLWQNEHGEQNGDEINIIDQPGANYGWPIATYGVDYSTGEPIGDLPHERDDTVNPIYYWDGTEYDDGQQGFPPSGMVFYDGEAFPEWAGQMFMGNLAHQYLGRFEVSGREILAEHRMLRDRGWRIRDVLVHPDSGHLYLLVDSGNAPLVRLSPEGGQ